MVVEMANKAFYLFFLFFLLCLERLSAPYTHSHSIRAYFSLIFYLFSSLSACLSLSLSRFLLPFSSLAEQVSSEYATSVLHKMRNKVCAALACRSLILHTLAQFCSDNLSAEHSSV